ncbi:ATP-dependent DNA helicase II subunit 1 [Savitreella phatthalungensis]
MDEDVGAIRELLADEDEQIDQQLYAAQKEALIFAIDISPSMHRPDPHSGQSPIRVALDCVYSFLTTKIISSPNDQVGVVLYGTKRSKFPQGMSIPSSKKLYFLCDMDFPDAPMIRQLREVLDDKERFDEVMEPADEQAALSDVFFHGANQVFSTRAPNYNLKRVILITDNDDPASTDEARKLAITRAGDLNDLGVKIEPIFIARSNDDNEDQKPFRSSKFWDEVVTRDDDDYDDNMDLVQRGAERMKQMMGRIKAKAVPKRAVFSIPLEIAPDFAIGIKGYILFKEQKIARTHNIYNHTGDRPEMVKTETVNIDVATSKTLDKTEIRRAYKFGNEQVIFTDEELKQIKYVEEPVLRILGFRDAARLEFWHNIRPSYFIYPTETNFVGSTRTFAALHASLLSKRKIAVAWFIPRRNANPCLVAMMPSREEHEQGTNLQITPPGIHLIQLPFADDIRDPVPALQEGDLGYMAPDSFPTELTDGMVDILNKILIPAYDPSRYPNPALQWHWKTLQAMALEEDMPQRDKDLTIPKYKGILKRAGDAIAEWNSLLERYASELPIEAAVTESSKKRKSTENTKREGDAPPRKLAKITEDDIPPVDELRRLAQAGQLERIVTVGALRAIIFKLKEEEVIKDGAPASARKPDLLRFVTDSLEI